MSQNKKRFADLQILVF